MAADAQLVMSHNHSITWHSSVVAVIHGKVSGDDNDDLIPFNLLCFVTGGNTTSMPYIESIHPSTPGSDCSSTKTEFLTPHVAAQSRSGLWCLQELNGHSRTSIYSSLKLCRPQGYNTPRSQVYMVYYKRYFIWSRQKNEGEPDVP